MSPVTSTDASAPESFGNSASPLAGLHVIAVSTARVVFGNERALRDALASLARQGATVDLVCRRESSNAAVKAFMRPVIHAIHEFELCEFPLRGWYLQAALQFLPRYVLSNISLFRLVRRVRRSAHGVVLLFGDQDAVITFNIAPGILGIPVLLRCGSAPAIHNQLRRVVLWLVRKSVDRFIVDSAFMVATLTSRGISTDAVEIIRPIPPERI